MGVIGDVYHAVSDSISQLAYAISKDGTGEALKFKYVDTAHSAAYNKMSNAARGVINTMGPEEAQAVRDIIKKGGDFNADGAFNAALTKMLDGDEATQKIAKDFNELRANYNTAKEIADSDSSKALGAYAEFLGRDNGKITLGDAASGYLGDKQYGATRIKAGIGVGVGIGVTSRVLSGGSLTRTNTGEQDIAGIPFI